MPHRIEDLKPCTVTVQADNERVKVTRYHFPPGTDTGWHRHEWDYVVVPTLAGTLTIIEKDGSTREVAYVPSESYFRTLGAEHNVANLSNGTVEFVEIELK